MKIWRYPLTGKQKEVLTSKGFPVEFIENILKAFGPVEIVIVSEKQR